MNRTVSVFGVGYLGLVTTVVLADKVPTIGFDSDKSKIRQLNQGFLSVFEPELEIWMKRNWVNLKFVEEPTMAVEKADIIFLTVDTPNLSDGCQDLSRIKDAVKRIGSLLKKSEHKIIAIKSTVLPKTTEKVIIPLLEEASNLKESKDFHVCTVPEFLREGHAIEDTVNPDKIVIGSNDSYATHMMKEFYEEFHERKTPILCTNFVNAEMIKYAQNVFLATKISFINTIANICERTTGADVEAVAEAIGLDKRISPFFFQAGLGFGGGCLPKDLNCFRKFSQQNEYNPILLNAVNKVNEAQPFRVVRMAESYFGDLKKKKFAVLGLSFKPETDDIRGAISLKIIETLLQKGAAIMVYDPKAMAKVKQTFGDRISYAHDIEECLSSADCCIIVTEWAEFQSLTPKLFRSLMKQPVIIDGRRTLNRADFKDFVFYGIGLADQDHLLREDVLAEDPDNRQ